MGGEVAERAPKGGKKGLRRPKRRIAIRIDMTPMVDIAFLLLIFYMVTTVFAMPQAMEINLPPVDDQDEEVIVKESNLLTIRVDSEERYWWNLKRVKPDNLPQLVPSSMDKPDSVAYVIDTDSLQALMVEKNRANNRLNTLIMIHRDANYADMVNILDEIDVIERSWNSFKAAELGIKVEDLSKDDKFSYRYAIGNWEDRDSRIIDQAERQMLGGDTGGEQ
jgi:biopolymer transport protein ExbD